MILENCICAMRGRNPDNPNSRETGLHTEQRLEVNENGTSNTLTSVQKDNLVLIKQATKDGYIPMEVGGVFDGSFSSFSTRSGRVQKRGSVSPTLRAKNNELYRVEKIGQVSSEGSESGSVYDVNSISPTLTAGTHGYAMGNILINYRIRKLTPKECFRLMGVGDEDADKMIAVNSNTQCYKQAGNSIVVDVMAAMFKKLF